MSGGQDEIMKAIKEKEMQCPAQPEQEECGGEVAGLVANITDAIGREGREVMSNQTGERKRAAEEIQRELRNLGEAIERSDSGCGKRSDDLKSSLGRKIESAAMSASTVRVAVAESLREEVPTLDEIESTVSRIISENGGLSEADIARIGDEVAARFQRATAQHETKARQETKNRVGSLRKAVDANWKRAREAFQQLADRSSAFQEKVSSRMDVTTDEARSLSLGVHALYDAVVKLEASINDDVNRLNSTLASLRAAVEELQEAAGNKTDFGWAILLLDKLEVELDGLRDRDLGDSLNNGSYQNSNYSRISLRMPVLFCCLLSRPLLSLFFCNKFAGKNGGGMSLVGVS